LFFVLLCGLCVLCVKRDYDFHMIEPPEIENEAIAETLRSVWGLAVTEVTFLPLGVDLSAAVYRAVGPGGEWFVKLRRGRWNEAAVRLPAYLHALGIDGILAPLPARAGELWAGLGAYRMIVYPYVAGVDGYAQALTLPQWRAFGERMRQIHAVTLPADLAGQIPRESGYSPFPEEARVFLQLAMDRYDDDVAARLAAFLRRRRTVIAGLAERTEQYAARLQAEARPVVLCHADLHAGNLLITPGGPFYLVDWDQPMFAPPERDLALVGGSPAWADPAGVAAFYAGYGSQPDPLALTYYRYDRILTDLVLFCADIFEERASPVDREQSYRYLSSTFEPGRDLDLARRGDPGC
jgi:spectinomycin phosphotransferase